MIPFVFIIGYFTFVVISSKHEVYMSIAESKSTPIPELEYLFEKAQKGNDSGILLFLAQNKNAPPDILSSLSKVPYAHVRVFVAGHPNTPTSIVEKMISDSTGYVRKSAQEELARRKVNK